MNRITSWLLILSIFYVFGIILMTIFHSLIFTIIGFAVGIVLSIFVIIKIILPDLIKHKKNEGMDNK